MAKRTKEENKFLAEVADEAERYDEMVDYVRLVVSDGEGLEPEERNLLSVAFKNAIGSRRASWRVISSIEQKDAKDDHAALAKKYREEIEKELKSVANDILSLIDKHLASKAKDTESKIFYSKMKGDYYRYLAEFATGEERKSVAESALNSYKEAYELASGALSTTHPIRLGLALNFSVFYYEILNNPEKACRLAKSAFDEAIADIDSVADTDNNTYKDSCLILQLLRDNLTLWTNDMEAQEQEEKPSEPPATERREKGGGEQKA